MPTTSNDIVVLRQAIERTIEYLHRLSPVPATSAVITELQAALDRPGDQEATEAAFYSPAGELLVNVVVRGEDLLIATDLPRERSEVLWQALAGDGLVLRLTTQN